MGLKIDDKGHAGSHKTESLYILVCIFCIVTASYISTLNDVIGYGSPSASLSKLYQHVSLNLTYRIRVHTIQEEKL